MVITNSTTYEKYALILDVQNENERYSLITIGTNTDDAVNGSIAMAIVGQYRYTIYGQNSDTNLDQNNATVVGEVENGVLWILNTDEYFNAEEIDIPPFTIQD